MPNRRFARLAAILCPAVAVAILSAAGRSTKAAAADAEMIDSQDPSGQLRTLSPGGPLDLDNPFFQDLGTNGRRCVTCHQPDVGWTITPANVQERFRESRGADPIFTNNDGSTCEGAVARSLADKRAAYGLLLTRGLFRIGLDVPPGAEFVIESVSDPNRCGPATNDTSQ